MVAIIYSMEDQPSDREFMDQMYMEFERLMFFTARQYASKTEIAEDIVQESLVRLYGKVQTMKQMKQVVLAAYIRATVRNTAINALRKMNREKDYAADADAETDAFTRADQARALDTMMDLSGYRVLLSKIWPQLPEEDRLLLEGKYILGYSDQELAAEIGCRANSVRVKLTQARRRALTIIQKQEGVNCFDEA